MTFLDKLQQSTELLDVWKDEHPAEFQKILDNKPDSQFLQDFWGQLSGGPRLAAIKGYGPEEMEALLVMAHDQIKAGFLPKARETLQLILMLDPYEDRALYTYACTLQMEGQYSAAGMFFMHYVMMKALEPRGYLRIGECLLGDGHIAEAKEYITGALEQAIETGDELTKSQAEAVLSEIEQATNVARNHN